jgi:mRNA interferase MazF
MAGAVVRRGQFVVVATSGDYGKPRPALVVQSDLFAELPSAVICPLTTMLRDDADQFRLEVDPSKRNGLREVSQIAIDKITVVPVAKIGDVIGEASDALQIGAIAAKRALQSLIRCPERGREPD